MFDRWDPLTGAGGGVPVTPRQRLRALVTMLRAAESTTADVLDDLADGAALALPAADGVGIVAAGDAGREVAGTTAAVTDLELAQLRLAEGPAVDALAGGQPVGSPDLSADVRWPGLVQERRTGVRAAMSVPLVVEGRVLGALSAYATTPGAFGPDDHARAVGVAAEVAVVVDAALATDRSRREELRARLSEAEQAVVEQAVSVLVRDEGVGVDEALAVLQTLGRTDRTDLVTVAREVLADSGPGG